MLIKITDTDLHEHLFARDEFKNTVAHDDYVMIILKGPMGSCYKVSPDEMARIEPLLTGEQTCPSALPDVVIAAFNDLEQAFEEGGEDDVYTASDALRYKMRPLINKQEAQS